MIKRYDHTIACPKCGGYEHSLEWAKDSKGEYLHWTCRKCRFQMDFLPLDAVEEPIRAQILKDRLYGD